MFCKTYDESLQKQAVNMDLQCILYIADSSYAVRTPKDEVTCVTYWNFQKKLKIRRCFPQNERFQDQTGGQETNSQNGRVGMYALYIIVLAKLCDVTFLNNFYFVLLFYCLFICAYAKEK